MDGSMRPQASACSSFNCLAGTIVDFITAQDVTGFNCYRFLEHSAFSPLWSHNTRMEGSWADAGPTRTSNS
jgi:hypothetical protein